jgi:hypothetical protein
MVAFLFSDDGACVNGQTNRRRRRRELDLSRLVRRGGGHGLATRVARCRGGDCRNILMTDGRYSTRSDRSVQIR